jgi:hypothetical protein
VVSSPGGKEGRDPGIERGRESLAGGEYVVASNSSMIVLKDCIIRFPNNSFGWWLMAGADLF